MDEIAPASETLDPRDDALMERALAVARDAAALGETPVGALVYDPETDSVIAEAGNAPISERDPTAHAEIRALRAAAAARGNYRLTGLWLYSTLEPCAMCAGAIAHARIARLVIAADDPKGGAVLHGPRLYEQPTIHWRPEVASGLKREAAAAMLRAFFKERRS